MDVFVTQDLPSISADPINYTMFIKMFNSVSRDYKAVKFPGGGVVIKDDADVVANLGSQSIGWQFDSAAFNWDELKLMADLAATVPIYRDKSDSVMEDLRKASAEERLSEMRGRD